jgi:hypothetical protein
MDELVSRGSHPNLTESRLYLPQKILKLLLQHFFNQPYKNDENIFLSPLLGLFLISITFKSRAETYYGEFCWQTLINEVSAWIYKFGVSQKEGGNFVPYGREDNGLGEITPALGVKQ